MDAEQLQEIRVFRTNYENGKNVSSYDVINLLDVLFPALLAEVDRLRIENEALRAALIDIEEYYPASIYPGLAKLIGKVLGE